MGSGFIIAHSTGIKNKKVAAQLEAECTLAELEIEREAEEEDERALERLQARRRQRAKRRRLEGSEEGTVKEIALALEDEWEQKQAINSTRIEKKQVEEERVAAVAAATAAAAAATAAIATAASAAAAAAAAEIKEDKTTGRNIETLIRARRAEAVASPSRGEPEKKLTLIQQIDRTAAAFGAIGSNEDERSLIGLFTAVEKKARSEGRMELLLEQNVGRTVPRSTCKRPAPMTSQFVAPAEDAAATDTLTAHGDLHPQRLLWGGEMAASPSRIILPYRPVFTANNDQRVFEVASGYIVRVGLATYPTNHHPYEAIILERLPCTVNGVSKRGFQFKVPKYGQYNLYVAHCIFLGLEPVPYDQLPIGMTTRPRKISPLSM